MALGGAAALNVLAEAVEGGRGMWLVASGNALPGHPTSALYGEGGSLRKGGSTHPAGRRLADDHVAL